MDNFAMLDLTPSAFELLPTDEVQPITDDEIKIEKKEDESSSDKYLPKELPADVRKSAEAERKDEEEEKKTTETSEGKLTEDWEIMEEEHEPKVIRRFPIIPSFEDYRPNMETIMQKEPEAEEAVKQGEEKKEQVEGGEKAEKGEEKEKGEGNVEKGEEIAEKGEEKKEQVEEEKKEHVEVEKKEQGGGEEEHEKGEEKAKVEEEEKVHGENEMDKQVEQEKAHEGEEITRGEEGEEVKDQGEKEGQKEGEEKVQGEEKTQGEELPPQEITEQASESDIPTNSVAQKEPEPLPILLVSASYNPDDYPYSPYENYFIQRAKLSEQFPSTHGISAKDLRSDWAFSEWEYEWRMKQLAKRDMDDLREKTRKEREMKEDEVVNILKEDYEKARKRDKKREQIYHTFKKLPRHFHPYASTNDIPMLFSTKKTYGLESVDIKARPRSSTPSSTLSTTTTATIEAPAIYDTELPSHRYRRSSYEGRREFY